MITLDPVTVGSTPFTVQLWASGQLGSPPSEVRVANESPYALQISVAGSDHWLQAWTADVYPAQGAGKMQVNPSLLTTAATPPSSQLLVSVAEQGETFPGSYPMALDRVTTISAGTVDIGTITGTVQINGGPITVENAAGTALATQSHEEQLAQLTNSSSGSASVEVTPDTGCRTLVLFFGQTGFTTLTVVGVQSGNTYYSFDTVPAGYSFLPWIPLDSDTDVEITVTFPEADAVDIFESFDVLAQVVIQSAIVPARAEDAPQLIGVIDGATLSLNQTAQLVPAASNGQDNYLHWFTLQLGTAALVAELIGATSGKVLDTIYPPAANAIARNEDWKGARLALLTGSKGEELLIKNITSGTQFVYAKMGYSQA